MGKTVHFNGGPLDGERFETETYQEYWLPRQGSFSAVYQLVFEQGDSVVYEWVQG